MKKIITILYSLVLSLSGYSQITIKEGKDAVYVFVSNRGLSPENPADNLTGAILERSGDNEKEFRSLGRVQAQITREGFVKTAGLGVLKNIMTLKELKSEEEAWAFVKANPELEKYGILALNMDFLVAMGAVYKDTEAKKFKNVRYRIEYLNISGTKEKPIDGSLALGGAPVIEKPKLKDFLETDSSITISWTLTPEKSPEAFMGEIWMQEKANAPFRKAGSSLALQVEDKIIMSWTEPVKPEQAYGFYVVPVTLVGLEGPRSDTTQLISRTFTDLPQVPIANVSDTLGGILITWNKINSTELISGILVERSKNPAEGFILLDTIPSVSTSFYDQRILPNTLYHYRFRTLGLRQGISEPSAYVSHQLVVENRSVEAPENVVSGHDKAGNVYITWERVLSPEIGGYQVFRAPQGNDNFEPVSNLLDENTFTDTTVRNSRIVYKYAVKAFNFENRASGLSEVVFASPAKRILPPPPYNVESYSEPGRISIRWKDMVPFDESVVSYTVYRKEVTAGTKSSDREISAEELKKTGFTRINTHPLAEVMFPDRTVSSGKTYQYAVTATDAYGVEGPALGIFSVSAGSIHMPVPEIYPRATSKGVEITWTDLLTPPAEKYEIYVRTPNEKIPRKLGEAAPGKEQFTDARAVSGQLYFYSMKLRVNGQESNFGKEKSVRK